MDRVSFMRESLGSRPVKFLEFTRCYSNNPKALICFFEGEDVKYYGIRIESHLKEGSSWFFVECSGKNDVLHLYEIVTSHSDYKNAKALFFIDRDFDEPIAIEYRKNIYETPCYSIENFYVTKKCFKKILESEFKVTEFCEQSECYNKCIDLFSETQKKYHDAVTLLNAVIKAHRIKEKELGNHKLNLNNVGLHQLVEISLGEVEMKYSMATINSIFPDAMEIDHDMLDTCIASFNGKSPNFEFRGKYELEFLRHFLIKLIADRRKVTPKVFSQKGNVKINLSKKNLISELSQYADTPPCLIKFIQETNGLLN